MWTDKQNQKQGKQGTCHPALIDCHMPSRVHVTMSSIKQKLCQIVTCQAERDSCMPLSPQHQNCKRSKRPKARYGSLSSHWSFPWPGWLSVSCPSSPMLHSCHQEHPAHTFSHSATDRKNNFTVQSEYYRQKNTFPSHCILNAIYASTTLNQSRSYKQDCEEQNAIRKTKALDSSCKCHKLVNPTCSHIYKFLVVTSLPCLNLSRHLHLVKAR